MHKVLSPVDPKSQPKRIRRLELPGRTEIEVGLPVEGITRNDEGLTEKQKIRGVYFAGAVTKLQAGYLMTSTVNTTKEKVR